MADSRPVALAVDRPVARVTEFGTVAGERPWSDERPAVPD